MTFESELSKGKFFIPECNTCKKIVWPPSEFCNDCFGSITLKNENPEGKIIEFSKQNNDYFCLVEFDINMRIIAKSSKIPELGKSVRISKCGIIDGNYFFHIN